MFRSNLASKIPKFFRSYAFVLAGNATAGILSFLISVLLSRSMSMEGFGAFSLFFTIATLVWQLPAFLDSTYIRYARTASPEEADRLLRVNLVYKIRGSGLTIGLAPLAGWILSRFLFPGKASPLLLGAAVVTGGLMTFLNSSMADDQARERFERYALWTISFYACVLAVIVPLAGGNRHLTPPAAGAVFLGAAAAVGFVSFRRLFRRIRPLVPLDTGSRDRMLSLGKWILVTNLLYIVLQRIDMLIIGHLVSPTDLGVYSAASRLLSALTIFLSAAAALYLPRAAVAAESRANLRRYVRESGVLTAAILAVILFFIVASPWLVTAFFGSRFAAASVPLRALYLGHIPQALGLPAAYLLYGLEDSRSNFLAMALCLVVNIAVNVIVTPRIGFRGPGWAFGAGYAAYMIVVWSSLLLAPVNRRRLAETS